MTRAHTTPLVLLVEDDIHDAELIRDALLSTGFEHDLRVVRNAGDALAFLQAGTAEPSLRPSLVILDFRLGDTSGVNVLDRLKSDATLRVIPVLMLSGSADERDVWRAYDHYANAYLVKPHRPEDFRTVMQRLVDFYLRTTQLVQRTP